MIFYESPVRLVKTLSGIYSIFWSGQALLVSRELTKLFEENRRGTLHEVCVHFKEKNPKGEIVIVVAGL